MNAPLRILQVEDSATDAELIARELQRGGLVFEVLRVHDEASYLEALKTPPDLVLSDFALPELDGLTALGLLKQRHPDVPFILVSGAIGEERQREARRSLASPGRDRSVRGAETFPTSLCARLRTAPPVARIQDGFLQCSRRSVRGRPRRQSSSGRASAAIAPVHASSDVIVLE